MRIRAFLVLSLFIFIPGVTLAQGETATATPTDTTSDDLSEIEIEQLVDQQLADEDLTTDVEAEVLPSDGFQFVLENALFNIRRAFTFQAERKAQLDQDRLQKLDRKLTACAEIGDTHCVDRLQEMIAAAEDRAQRYLEKKQEVLGNIESNFEAWRQRRQEHIEAMEEMAQEHADELDERLEELKAKRDQAREDHQEHMEELRQQRQQRIDRLKTSIQERMQNREHLIEVRSHNLKDKLDSAREGAADYQQQFDDALKSVDD